MHPLQIAAQVDARADAALAAQHTLDAYSNALEDEASERAANITTDPVAFAEWLMDRMETSAPFAESVLDLIVERLRVEIEAEWKSAREAL